MTQRKQTKRNSADNMESSKSVVMMVEASPISDHTDHTIPQCLKSLSESVARSTVDDDADNGTIVVI